MELWKRYPEDEDEKIIGIKLPFNRSTSARYIGYGYSEASEYGAGLFNFSYTTEEQAISNLINLLLTRKGERYMQPDLGSRIPDWVFEQNTKDERWDLEESIKRDIAFWLPYIIVGNLTVEPGGSNTGDPDPMHAVTISIPFRVTEQGANRTVTFFIVNEGAINFEVV